MKTFGILFMVIACICTAAYSHGEEGTSQPVAFPFDQDQLLNRLADLKPFKSEKGEFEQERSSFLVTQDDFRNSLVLLIKEQEKVDEIMAHFSNAAAFSFKNGTQLLTLMQWTDSESAQEFMKLRYELWRLTDKEYQQYIRKVVYEEIDLTKNEKALLTRKTIQQSKQKQDVTTFISARDKYLFECTLIGDYRKSDVKKLILQIWKIIDSEEKKGVH
jgi:hypothetical protein